MKIYVIPRRTQSGVLLTLYQLSVSIRSRIAGEGFWSLPERADGRKDGFRKAGIILWLVFQMPVRYTDFGCDTGNPSDEGERELLHSDYYGGTLMDS